MNPKILIAITEEMRKANEKHPRAAGGMGLSQERNALILAEECGEVMKAVVDFTRPIITPLKMNEIQLRANAVAFQERNEAYTQIAKELVQVAAVAIRWLENMTSVVEEKKAEAK